MCGIIGVASCRSIKDRSWLVSGRDKMTHRGPDDAGEWWNKNGTVGLAHRRLAVIDLSEDAHQPMHDITNTVTLVFNGEIYNFKDLKEQLTQKKYTFFTHSDSEVIIAAWQEWGIECVSHLNGMFAFAIYDSRLQKIFIARDRAGEKPLFYSHKNGELRFSSELKGLMADKEVQRTISPVALDCYLAMGYIPGNSCIIKDVKKLPPAHALLFDCNDGTSKIWQYWHLPDFDLNATQKVENDNELLVEFDTLLEDSVRRQMVADVPVGVLLSGGVDSSLLTAIASRVSENVKTFTVVFSGSKEHDESAHARLISNYFGTVHLELEANNVDSNIMFKLAKQYDEPMCDSSIIPTYLVSRLVRQHCTVAIGGDGGDELFGGYKHYNRLLWTQKYFNHIPIFVRRTISRGSEKILPVGFKGRNWLQALGTDLDNGLPLIASFFDPEMRQKLAGHNPGKHENSESIRAKRIPKSKNLLQRATRMEFENYMPEDILVKVDRASMLNSLEIRAPLLDHRIIEFAFGKVPASLKATTNQRKIFLKKYSEKILPREFDKTRKQGFSIPLDVWLRNGSWRDLFHDVLLDSGCYFDKKTIISLLRGQDAGRYNTERLFSLVLFDLWRREYAIY